MTVGCLWHRQDSKHHHFDTSYENLHHYARHHDDNDSQIHFTIDEYLRSTTEELVHYYLTTPRNVLHLV
jgi:hypothetical protein